MGFCLVLCVDLLFCCLVGFNLLLLFLLWYLCLLIIWALLYCLGWVCFGLIRLCLFTRLLIAVG